ncbi:LOW QUALITY PROTEIN: GTPase IMAP family member 4-like [Cariama cristata]
MRFLLVGKSGAGKSATGNTLLGEYVFKSKLMTKLVTVSSVQAKDITVIDTTDIFDPRAAISEAYKEITHCVKLSSPGPYTLLLVTELGQFIKEDKEAMSPHHYRRYCGNGALQDLILRRGSRYCGLNDKAVGAERDQQIAKLMGMVCRVVQENGGKRYHNATYLGPSLTEEKVEYHAGSDESQSHRSIKAGRDWRSSLEII